MFIAELTTYGQSVASSQVTIDGIILISEYVSNIDSADISQAVLDIDACGSINKNSGSVRVIDTSSNVYAIRTILFYTLSGSTKKVVAGYSQEESFVLKTAGVLNVLLPFDFSVFTSGFLFATVQSGYSNAAHNTDGVLHIENPDTNADDNYSVYSKTQVDDLISDVSYTAGDGISLSNNVIKTTGIPFGICDSTSTSTKFTVTVPGIYKLEDGVTCMVKNSVVTSASGFTLNVNGLGAKPCYTNLAAATRETTIFNVAYTMLFVYDSTRVSGGCWICYRGYDSNTNTVGYQLRTNSTVMNVSDTARYYKLYFTSADGNLWVPASVNSTNDATTARAVNQRPINPFGRIVYTSANTNYATGANLAATTIWDQYNLALGYSFNVNGGTLALTAEKPVYVKCAPQTDGSAIIDATNPTVQDLPTSSDGKIYIFLGTATSATAVELFQNHPVYYHDGNGIKLWSGVVLPSKTSDLTNDSGFITEEDIPTNVSAFNNDVGYLTSYTETDPTVPAWAKQATKPSYTLDEVTDGSTRKLSNYVPTSRKINNKALSSDITLNLDDVLDGSTRKLSNYVPYSEIISTINGFDNRRLWQYEIHNTLWAANKRYDVTLTGFSNNNAAASLFDGSFETNVVVPKNGTGVILISGKNNTKMWGGGYPYGYLEVAFYYTNVPESVTCRVYSDWTQNPGWHDVTLTNVCKNSNQALYRGVNTGFYGVTQVEITVNAKDSVTANVTEVAFYQTRGTLQQMSVFNKTVAQTLYHDLTGTKFIVSGGTSSQFLKADGSLDSSAYITSASIPTNVSAFNNDAGYLTSHQSLSSVVASAQYNSTSKKIEFYNPSGTKLNTDIDASAFIKDGMVDTVEVSGGNLVITFNTDAGKEDIEIPISDIFDANNYYTKAQVDGLIPTVNNAKLTIKKNASDTGTEFTANASTNVTCNLGLATVATSGSYNDLSNKPTIPTVNDTTITIKKNTSDAGDSFTTNTATAKTINLGLSTVATSGSYNDLSNKPTIPTVNNASLTINKGGTDDTGSKTFTANASSNVTINLGLSTVASSGSYNDLSNKPTIPTVNNSTITIKKNSDDTGDSFTTNASSGKTINLGLATVATSGSYNDLSNKPTIPTVNNATLTIQKNGTTVKTFTANASSNVTANITVPLESISVDSTAQTITNGNVDLHIPADITSYEVLGSFYRNNVSGSGNISIPAANCKGLFPAMPTAGTYKVRVQMYSSTASYTLNVSYGSGNSYSLTSSGGIINDERTLTIAAGSSWSAALVSSVGANTVIIVRVYKTSSSVVTEVGAAAVSNSYFDLDDIPAGVSYFTNDANYVTSSRKINNKALSSDITLTLDDVADGSTRAIPTKTTARSDGKYLYNGQTVDTMIGNFGISNSANLLNTSGVTSYVAVRADASNPLIGLKCGSNLWYCQASQDKFYFGPTSAKALMMDQNGNGTFRAGTCTATGFVYQNGSTAGTNSDVLRADGSISKLKTINNESIFGSGNISVSGGGGDVNVIESISVNGTTQTVTNKNVDISVPTNTNQLTNGAGFITASDISGKQDTLTAGSGIAIDTSDDTISATGIPFGIVDGTSTSTAFTAAVPGIDRLEDGVCCMLKNGVVTSASTGFTININNLGAKPVYSNMAAATAETTMFNVNYTMLFVYDSTRVSGGCWILYRGYYQSDTDKNAYQIRLNTAVLPASDTSRYYKLFFTSADGTALVPASVNSSNNITTARTPNQKPINPFGRIAYTSATTSYAAGANVAAATLWDQYVFNLAYSYGPATPALTPKLPVYIKCTPQSDGSAIVNSTTPVVQTLPQTADGSIYIFIGIAYYNANSQTMVELMLEKPVYYHDGSCIKLWTGSNNYVTTNTDQFITGQKTFNREVDLGLAKDTNTYIYAGDELHGDDYRYWWTNYDQESMSYTSISISMTEETSADSTLEVPIDELSSVTPFGKLIVNTTSSSLGIGTTSVTDSLKSLIESGRINTVENYVFLCFDSSNFPSNIIGVVICAELLTTSEKLMFFIPSDNLELVGYQHNPSQGPYFIVNSLGLGSYSFSNDYNFNYRIIAKTSIKDYVDDKIESRIDQGVTQAEYSTYASQVGIRGANSDASYPLLFTSSVTSSPYNSTYNNIYTDTSNDLYYNPSANTLTCATFNGSLTGNADTATTASLASESFMLSTINAYLSTPVRKEVVGVQATSSVIYNLIPAIKLSENNVTTNLGSSSYKWDRLYCTYIGDGSNKITTVYATNVGNSSNHVSTSYINNLYVGSSGTSLSSYIRNEIATAISTTSSIGAIRLFCIEFSPDQTVANYIAAGTTFTSSGITDSGNLTHTPKFATFASSTLVINSQVNASMMRCFNHTETIYGTWKLLNRVYVFNKGNHANCIPFLAVRIA
jgi:hypothetical protein